MTSGTVAVTALGAVNPAMASTPGDGGIAAGWLANQYADGVLTYGGSPSLGMTLDGVLALTSRKVAADVAARATTNFETVARSYISGGGTENRSAGAVAKVALVAQVQNRSITNFGGEDLLATLESLKASTGVNAGRYRDKVSAGGSDWSGTFSQSLALLVMSRADAVAADSVAYLVASQCDNGGFPSTASATTGACNSNDDVDNDSTAMALQALNSAGVASRPGVSEAIDKAANYLVNEQGEDGSFDAPPWVGANANTTGLVAQTLRIVGRASEADRATAWLTGLQVSCQDVGLNATAELLGAVAYDPESKVALLTTGANSSALDQLRYTQTQAVFGFVGSDGFSTMSAIGATTDIPAPSCGAQRKAPLQPQIAGIKFASSMKSVRIFTNQEAGLGTVYRIRKGFSGGWSAWTQVSTGAIALNASKTARTVELKATSDGGESVVTSVLIQVRRNSAALRRCQPIGAVTIVPTGVSSASASFSKRKKSCAQWRTTSNGRWKKIQKGKSSLPFRIPTAVGVNWQVRTGSRTTSISVRSPR